MALRVVTDSTADLPPKVAEELGIVVVPLAVNFGNEYYLDGVDLSADEFYHKLQRSPTLPTTSQPSPGAFAQTYDRLAAETSEILSIHISAKLSGTYASAIAGRDLAGAGADIEVIDSLQASMGLGLLAIMAAKAANNGASLDAVVEMVERAMPRTQFFGAVDTLEYLQKGGRIGKAQFWLGTLLNVKPLIACRDGETHPLERVRSRKRALERLVELALEHKSIQDMAVMHSTTPADAELIGERLSAAFPEERIYRARFGPVIGTYLGPGAVGVALREGD